MKGPLRTSLDLDVCGGSWWLIEYNAIHWGPDKLQQETIIRPAMGNAQPQPALEEILPGLVRSIGRLAVHHFLVLSCTCTCEKCTSFCWGLTTHQPSDYRLPSSNGLLKKLFTLRDDIHFFFERDWRRSRPKWIMAVQLPQKRIDRRYLYQHFGCGNRKFWRRCSKSA